MELAVKGTQLTVELVHERHHLFHRHVVFRDLIAEVGMVVESLHGAIPEVAHALQPLLEFLAHFLGGLPDFLPLPQVGGGAENAIDFVRG